MPVESAASEPAPGWRALWPALALFALCRLAIGFGFGEYVSDVHLYHEAADRALSGERAYVDFFFPYPPASLPLVYLPGTFARQFAGYRGLFRLEMALFDLACLAALVALGRRLRLGLREARLAIVAFGLLGLAVGHLLYDRLDPVVALTLLLLLSLPPGAGAEGWGRRAAAWAGTLVKLAPALLLPVGWLLRWTGERGRGAGRGAAARRLLRDGLWELAPVVAVLGLWNAWTSGALFAYLGQHGARGIEIESLWATPIWLGRRLLAGLPVPIDHRYGGQHLAAEVVEGWYLALSKVAGFALLAGFWAAAAWALARRRRREPAFRPGVEELFALGLASLALLVAGQRILSPQYLIWLAPALALWMARRGNAPWVPVVGLVYYLTWEGFARGYWRFVAGEPYYVAVYAARNLALAVLAAVLVRDALRSVAGRPAVPEASAEAAGARVRAGR